MNRNTAQGNIMLVLTAMIWGAAFVAQDLGMAHVEPFTFNAARMLLGAVALLPVIAFEIRRERRVAAVGGNAQNSPLFTKNELLGGFWCGVILFAASSLQQIGISLYSESEAAAGKSGFITALYIVIVPVIGLFLKKKGGLSIWLSVAIALAGMYLLCIREGFRVSLSDAIVFLGAVIFALHILVIDYYSPKTNGIKMSAVQILTAGIFSLVFALFLETPTAAGLSKAALPILYAGIISCSVAYTMQVVAQKNTTPAAASIILSLESVFAAITGVFFGERLTGREAFGCVLVFAAVLLTQIDFSRLDLQIKSKKAAGVTDSPRL